MKWFFCFFFLIGKLLAQDCSPQNLITEKDSPFSKIPVYDQDGARNCHAYVASQLINYHLIKKGATSTVVHPTWVTYVAAKKNIQDGFRGGWVHKSIEAVVENGNCSYAAVTDSLKEWATKAKVTEAELINFIDSFRDHYLKIYRNSNSGPRNLKQDIQASISSLKTEDPSCSQGAFENLALEFESFVQVAPIKILASLLEKQCPKSSPLDSSFAIDRKRMKTDEEYSQSLQQRLTQDKSPVAIEYCGGIWNNPSLKGLIEGIDRRMGVQSNKHTSDCSLHTSLVVGQKKMNNSCHFLVRNNWGNLWGNSNRNYKCLCQNIFTMEYVDDCTIQTHNNGMYSVEGCWVDSKILIPNSYELIQLK